MHPDEKSLRTVSELTPALRELVARMARSAAKDAVQDVMENKGMVFSGGTYVSRAEAVAALDTCEQAWRILMDLSTSTKDREHAVETIENARSILKWQVMTVPDECSGGCR
jgi:hypothetical protein